MNKMYLGDSVYVEHDGYNGITLTTENGIRATNTIVLEYDVIRALGLYLKSQGITDGPKEARKWEPS